MQAREIMSKDPACCSASTSIKEVAQMMADEDCGEIPVLNQQGRLAGVVTDRDIACRAVAKGKGPKTPVRDVMSGPVVTAAPEEDGEECCRKLQENQIRRLPVVDEAGTCCGMVSQADIAQRASQKQVGQMVRDISQPSEGPSRVGCC